MLITVSAFVPNPPIQYPGENPHVRGWYSNDFVADDQVTPILGGNGQTGFYYDTLCTFDEDHNLVVPSFIIQSTTGVSPTGRFFLQLFDDNGSPLNMLMGAASGWAIPTQYGSTVNFYQLALYNAALFLYTAPNNVFTQDQTISLIRSMIATLELATDTEAGVVFLSVPADDDSFPVVWGANDPLVRNATELQGVDISDTAPSDGQFLSYNDATGEWEPSTAGFGSGNVVSNEVSSVDGELALMSGTGGHNIKKADQTGVAVLNSGVLGTEEIITREVPAGVIDGANPTFTLANTPVAGSESVFVAGSLQNSDVAFTLDYTISGATITFQAGHIPAGGVSVLVSYRRTL